MVMDNSKNSRVFNFATLLKSRISRKFDAREIYMFYIICLQEVAAGFFCYIDIFQIGHSGRTT